METALAGKEAIAHTVEWYQAWLDGADMAAFTDRQIREYLVPLFTDNIPRGVLP